MSTARPRRKAIAEQIRVEIREGRFGQPVATDQMTLRQLCDLYLERFVRVEHAATAQEYVYVTGTVCRTTLPQPTGERHPLGDWRLADIVTDTVLRFREVRRSEGTGLVGVNRNVRALRAIFNWGLRTGYVDSTPFKRNGESVIKLWKEPSRSRRLNADTDEEGQLLAACGPHLRAEVECALATSLRKGEISTLQWSQIEGLRVQGSTLTWAPRAEIVLPWMKTKMRRHRRIPISSRLRGILELRRLDPTGRPLPETAYVFGNALGRRCGISHGPGTRPS